MKFTLSKAALTAIIIPAAKAVPRKTAIPILESLLIESDGKTLTVTGSDQDVTIRTEHTFEQEEKGAKGAVCITASTLVELIKNLDGKTVVTFETTGESAISCKWDGGECSLPTFAAKDYPEVMRSEETTLRVCLTAAELTTLLHNTSYATDYANELKPALAAVYLCANPEAKTLTACASDSHVLATGAAPLLDDELAAAGEALIPRKSAEVFEKALPCDETTVVLEATPTSLRTTVPGQVIQCRTLVAKYMDFTKVIPKTANIFTADTETLRSALKIIATCSNPGHPGVIMDIEPMGIVHLEGEDPSRKTRAKQDVTGSYEGEKLTYCTQGDRLLEALDHITTEQVTLGFDGPKRPVVLRPDGYEGPGDPLALVMPIVMRKADDAAPKE